MSVVPLSFPVPYDYLPRRARIPRLCLVRSRCAVDVPEIDPAEVGPRIEIWSHRRPMDLHEIAGRLFLRVDEPGVEFRDAQTLLGSLGRSADGPRRTRLDLAIGGTPLSAEQGPLTPQGRPNHLHGRDHRGIDIAGLGPHEARGDPWEAAAAGAQEWVRANMRLCGDALYVDTGGPLLVPSGRGETRLFESRLFPRLGRSRAECVCGPFTPAEALDYRRRALVSHVVSVGGEGTVIDAPVLPPEAAEGRDTDRMFANFVPGVVLGALAPLLRTGPGDAPLEYDGIGLRRLALLGTIGCVPATAVEEACERAGRVARGGIGSGRLPAEDIEALNLVRGHVSDWIVARRREAAERRLEEDAPGLALLAP